MSHKGFWRIGAVAAVAGAAVLLSGGVASAHVTAQIIGEPATQGEYTKITFRVPNEEADAGTIKLEVKLPKDAPMASVRPKAVPGWHASVTKAKLDKPIQSHGTELTETVDTVTWTADHGVRINPGEFGEFELSAGRLPEVDQLIMPAYQTYDNDKVVAWDAPPPADGAAEPEHPAPVVALAPAGQGDDEAGAAAPANTGSGDGVDDGVDDTASAASTSDDTARWLGGIGIVVGALGVGFGVGATLRARRAVAAGRGGGEQ